MSAPNYEGKGMKQHITRLFRLAFAAVLALPAAATTLEKMSVEQLTRAAQVVVRARCASSKSQWDRSGIWTVSSFEVEEAWKSNVQGGLQVHAPGGHAGEVIATVAGVPHFRPGEDVVLFLERMRNGNWGITAWGEGTWRVRWRADGEEIAIPDVASGITAGKSSARDSTGEPESAPILVSGIGSERGAVAGAIPLGELRARVISAVGSLTSAASLRGGR
jgi:hypothetical protein